MLKMHILLTSLLAVLLLSACAQVEQRGKVHCPACGVELDALYETSY